MKLQLLLKAATGIDGFDSVSRGGVPRKRTNLLKGGAGAAAVPATGAPARGNGH